MKKYTAGVLPFFTAILILSALILPRQAAATVGFANQWPTAPTIVSNSAASPVSGKFSVGAGNNRLLVVAVATEYSAAQAPAFTVTYGGQSLNGGNGGVILNNTTGNNKIWIGYLKEAGIVAAGSNKTLSVTPSIATNLTALYATAAVFSGVDQSTPITGFGSFGRNTTANSLATSYTMTGNAGLAGNTGMSVYLTNWNNATGETTASTGYTQVRNYPNSIFSLSASYKTTTGASAESISSTSAIASGAIGGFGLNPAVKIATVSTCGDCHRYPPGDASARNVPPAMFRGSHEKHSGGNDKEYGYACNYCHYNVGGSAYNHSSGFKNITGSKLPGNAYSGTKKIAININPTLGTCNNTACHSTGRVNAQYTQSAAWGATGTITCLSCHAGRSATNPYPQANSTAGFKLSTTHSQHLKYPAANMNCNHCHGKTATDAATLKNYTATLYHADGSASVIFTDLAYGSANSYQGDKKCSNVACHGGTTKSPWSDNGTVNRDSSCLHCHGYGTTTGTALRADKYNAAPGWAGTGTSTDGNTSSSDIRVGGHFVHLSSVYMSKLKCNECHAVPSTPFEGTHMTGPRYNSASINFGQASTAIKNTTSTAFTPGTAVAPATCTTTYCHGSKMLLGDTAGTDKSPLWNANLTTGTPGAAECARCHGNPPNSVAGSHTGVDATTSCVGCHVRVVDINGKIINKSLHLNGLIESDNHPVPLYADAAGHIGCASGIGCHANTNNAAPYPAVSGAPDCRSCHKKADPITTANCGSCHGTGSTGNLAAPSGTTHPDQAAAHPKHVSLSLVTANCVYCHNIGGTGGNADHGPGNKGTNPAVVNVNQGWNGTTCNASYCHSTVQVATGGAGAPTYRTTTAWAGGAAMTCASCHGNTSANLTTGSHATHLSTTTHATFTCAHCHTGFENGNTTAHSNQIINVQQSLIKGSTGTYSDSAGAPGNGYGSCTLSYCHSSVQSTTGGALIAANYKTVNWGAAAMNCGSCHGNTSATLVSGAHAKHLAAPFSYACSTCHGTAGGAGNTAIHANEIINLDLTAKGPTATYSGDGIPQNSNFGTCSATVCHGRNSGTWSTTGVSTQPCTECHGQVNTAYLNVSSAIIAPGGSGVDTAGNSTQASARVGSHQTHLLASTGISDKIHCGECHTVHTAIEAPLHLNYTTATVTFGPIAKSLSHTSASVSRVSGIINCSNTECHHGGNRADGTAAGQSGIASRPALQWTSAALLGGTSIADTCTGKCHNMPPGGAVANDTHSSLGASGSYTTPAQLATACSSCHNPLSASASTMANLWANKNAHVNGIVDAASACQDCHNAAVGGNPSPAGSRRQILASGAGNGEFTITAGTKYTNLSSHVKTSAMADKTCEFCHAYGSEHKARNDGTSVLLQKTDGAGTILYNGTAASLNGFCAGCHRSAGYGGTIPTGATGTATQPYKDSNDTKSPQNVFSDWSSAGQFSGTSSEPGSFTTTGDTTVRYTHRKGAACMDCHGDNQPNSTTSPRINAHASKNGKMLRYSTTKSVVTPNGTFAESQTCFNKTTGCHGPASTVSWVGARVYNEFKVNNASAGTGGAHPILAAVVPKSTRISADTTGTTFVNGWKSSSVATCSDCHGGSVGGPRGPHGSTLPFILKPAAATSPSQTTSGTAFTAVAQNTRAFCLNCHAAYVYGNGNGAAGAGAGNRVGHGSTNAWSGTSNCSGPARTYMNNSCQNCHCGRGTTASGTGVVKGTHSTNTTTGGSYASNVGFSNGNNWVGGPWNTGSTSGCYVYNGTNNYATCNKGANHASSDRRFKQNFANIINPLRELFATDLSRYGSDPNIPLLVESVRGQQQLLDEQNRDIEEIKGMIHEMNR